MKKAVIKIISIFSVLILYCITEIMFLTHFTRTADKILASGQAAQTVSESKLYYSQAYNYIQDNRWILQCISSQYEWEMLTAGLGRYKDYLERDDLTEAVVAAGEVRSYLKQIK